MKYNEIFYYIIFLTEKTSECINMPNIMLIYFSTPKLRFKIAARSSDL